jgi:PAS domain S-box-containing protein
MSSKKTETLSSWDGITLSILIVIAFIGLCTLAAGHFPVLAQIQIIPGPVSMRYNTGLCLFLLGVSGAAFIARRGSRFLPALGGAAVALLGALVIFVGITKNSLPFSEALIRANEALFPALFRQEKPTNSGSFGIVLAICFICYGIALAIIALRPRALALFAIAHIIPVSFSFTSLLLYIVLMTTLLPVRANNFMSVPTALCMVTYGGVMVAYAWRNSPHPDKGLRKWGPAISTIIMLGFFVLISASSQGASSSRGLLIFSGLTVSALLALAVYKLPGWKISQKGLVLISVPFLFLLAFMVFVTDVKRSNQQAQNLSIHSKEVLMKTESLFASLVGAEASIRGYVISEDSAFRDVYLQATQKVPELTASLEDLVKDNPAQTERARLMSRKAVERMANLAHVDRFMREGNKSQAVVSIKSGNGKQAMDEFGLAMDEFLKEEERLDKVRVQAVERSWNRFNGLLIAGTSSAILLALMFAFLFSHGISSRLLTLTENAKALAEGRALASPLSGNDEIANLDTVFHDMAEKLREATRKELAVVENALDVICSIDKDGRFVKVSPASFKVWGYKPEELIGHSLTEFIFAEDIANTNQAIEEIKTGVVVTGYENRFRHKDGSLVFMKWSAFWSETEALLFCVVHDISELKQMQEALENYADEVSDLYHNAPCGYHSLDKDATFVQINDRELQWFGYSRAEVIGKMKFSDLLTPESLTAFQESFVEFKKEGLMQSQEFQMIRRDGTAMTVLLNAISIKDRDGSYKSSRSTLFDITDRKRAEEEIQKLNEDLERHARKLEAANKELEAFSYSVSHDLRAPLRAIDGFSRMFMEDNQDKLDAEGSRLINVIRNNTQKMAALIDDLLTFSRLGRRQVEPSSIDMTRLAEAVFQDLRINDAPRDIELKVNPLPPVIGDPTMVRQILVNLLSNAIKFTAPRKTAIIEVSSWVENGNNIYSIKDNGVGFDMQYANKLFGVFQRLHSTDEFDGTGVGLAIVNRIVSRHGGRVWAEANVDQGATFYFALPRGG